MLNTYIIYNVYRYFYDKLLVFEDDLKGNWKEYPSKKYSTPPLPPNKKYISEEIILLSDNLNIYHHYTKMFNT